MTHRRGKLFVALVSVAAVAASFAGIAAGRTRVAAPAGAASCSGPGIENGTIKIGVLYEKSGPQAMTFAYTVKGLNARLAKLEADGGLPNGLKLELVDADDQAGDAENLTAAKQLVEADKVFLVFEVTSHSAGSASYLNHQKVPVVGWAIDPVWGRFDNMFGYRWS